MNRSIDANRGDMSARGMDALSKALDLIHTPAALEVLGALSDGRSPYEVSAPPAVVTHAVELLRDLGAAVTTPRPVDDRGHVTTITERGRALYRRLVEIENSASADPPLRATRAN
jgi:hypothetical protein